jgi:hypothetical protein
MPKREVEEKSQRAVRRVWLKKDVLVGLAEEPWPVFHGPRKVMCTDKIDYGGSALCLVKKPSRADAGPTFDSAVRPFVFKVIDNEFDIRWNAISIPLVSFHDLSGFPVKKKLTISAGWDLGQCQ